MENSFYKQLCDEEARLKNRLALISELKKDYEVTNSEKKPNVFVSYSQDLTLPEKVVLALKRIGRGSSRDVADSLRELDSNFTEKAALDNCRHYLSKLASSKEIGAEKMDGKSNEYYIK